MASKAAEWNVLPHDKLEQLAENVWWTSGSLPGMSLRRSMVVAKRADGKVVVHNAIALDEAGMADLLAIGEPSYLVVPNDAHRLDAPAFKARFPQIRVFVPRQARVNVAKVVPVDGVYDEFPEDADVRLEPLAGVGDTEGVMHVRSSDGRTVVLNDVVSNMDKKSDFVGWLITTLFGTASGPRVSRMAKLFIVKDKSALRAELERLADLHDLVRLVVGHEKLSRGPEAAAVLRKAATFL